MGSGVDAERAVGDVGESGGSAPRRFLSPGPAAVTTIIAGLAFFGICRWAFPIPLFDPAPELLVPFPPPEVAVAREAALARARMLNAIVALGTLGLLLGGLVGAGEAAARRLRARSLWRLPVTVAVAIAFGCLGGLAGHLLTENLPSVKTLAPMGRTVLSQAGMLGLFGAGLGLALALVGGGGRAAGLGAATGGVAGILAGLLFPVACGLLLHRVKTEVVIPGGVVGGRQEPAALAFWIAFLVVAWGVIMPLAGRGKRITARAPEPEGASPEQR